MARRRTLANLATSALDYGKHFVRQDSSVVSYRRLDIWDISRIDWWQTSEDEEAEKVLLDKYKLYLNMAQLRPPIWIFAPECRYMYKKIRSMSDAAARW